MFILPLLLLFSLWFAAIKFSSKVSDQGLVKPEARQESIWVKSFGKGFDEGAKKRARQLRAKGYDIEWQSKQNK